MTSKLFISILTSTLSLSLFASTTQFNLIKSKLDKCPTKIFLVGKNPGQMLFIEDQSIQIIKGKNNYLPAKKYFQKVTPYNFGVIKYAKFKERCTYLNKQLLYKSFYNSDLDNELLAEALDQISAEQIKNIIINWAPTESKLFTTKGEIDSFDYNPPQYDLNHAINYYIPKSLKDSDRAKVMILLHGGGASTNTYESSKMVAKIYMEDFLEFAETEKTIIVAPSSSLGWSYLTRILLRNLSSMIREDLKVDSDKFYLFGHSMGGMGITRDAHWVIDQFAGIMPTAAGMQIIHQKDEYLRTFFNTNYIHINGIWDHFSAFRDRMFEVSDKMMEMEEKLGKRSGYLSLFHNGGHNYNRHMVYRWYRDDQFKKSRDLYQSSLYPLIGQLNIPVSNGWNPVILQHPLNSYMWIEAISILEDQKSFHTGFEAEISENIVNIKIDNSNKRIEKFRIYLSKKLIDFTKPITVIINDETKYKQKLEISKFKMIEIARYKRDPKFIFENYVDINLL